MSKSKIKRTDRIMSVVLAFVMVISMVPLTVFASTAANPDVFTFTVTDGTNPIAGATVTLSGDVEASADTDTNGEVAFSEFTSLEHPEIEVECDYTVSKNGYVTATGTINSATDGWTGNKDIVLTAATPETATVSVTKSGNGTVKLDDSETNTITVNKGEYVAVEITPASGSYIKELKINGQTVSVTKGEAFTDSLLIEDNTTVLVTFVREFTVSVSANTGGTVKLDNAEVSSKEYDEGSNAALSVVPNTGYQIASVSINGTDQTISNVNSFSTSINNIDAAVNVAVMFVKVYTITVSYDSDKGATVTDPACAGGSVTVNTGTEVSITATPKVNYRVSKVAINGVDSSFDDNTYDNSNPYTNTLTADKDYTVEITFAPLIYNITAVDSTNGSVRIDSAKVDYDGSTKVYIIPNAGYTVSSVLLNGTEIDVEQPDDETIFFEIDNITSDQEVEVAFVLVGIASMSDVSFNFGDALRANLDGTLYVFAKNSTVTFSTSKTGIRLYEGATLIGGKQNQNSYGLTQTKNISKIQLYYKAAGEKTNSWHDVPTVTTSNRLKIVIDDTKPVPVLTPDAANTNDYYKDDVSIAVQATDPGDYSGLSSVEYWITCDGTETKRETLYTFASGDSIKDTYTGNIIVDAEQNNSDNVKVYLKTTDRAGNEAQTDVSLKINTTKPTVAVSINGTLHSEAAAGYYNNTRTATVTIVDRATSFDATAANNGISITAKNLANEEVSISKAAMISSWAHSGDTHTATITFSTDARYEWNISYTNKADLTNESVTDTGASVYNFTVDTTAPTGSIFIETDTWNSLLSTLTFGIWKNYSVTATSQASDVTSDIYDVLYYKSNSDIALTEAELVALYDDGEFVSTTYTIAADEAFVIYARITDYAGNTLYIGTNGVIVDMTAGIITLTPDEPNESGFYNSDVDVDITVNEEAIAGKAYSGIKTIDYKVVKDGNTTVPTQSGNLYTFDITNPTKAQLKKDWSGSITVDKTKNNSDDIKVIVTVYDNAGNIYDENIVLAINIDTPDVTIDFTDDANKEVNGKGYFGATRVAIITITDRATAFNATVATNGIVIEAKDSKNNPVSLNTSSMISAWSHEGNKHTATVTFSVDGNYTWSFSYTNDAGNSNNPIDTKNSVTPFDFAVDKTKPTGTVTVNTNTWDKLLNILTFGLYNNVKADVSATAEDATSPVIIEYYKTNNPIAMTTAELDKQTFAVYNDFSVSADEQFVVYLKITDYAGNYIYINSDGYIVDTVESKITLTPDAPNSNGYYGKPFESTGINVKVEIEEDDPYSGIKTIDYWIVKDNDDANPTQEGNLFTFDTNEPTQAQLVNKLTKNITVDTAKNNSCNVVVYVKTVDNAGNENTKSVKLDIDVTTPKIDITYDNNKDNGGNGFFAAKRTATVVITERTHHFDATAATKGIVITAVDAKGNKVGSAYTISSWNTVSGANPDAATHTATIAFEKDANYTFAIAYTDKADNANTTPDTHTSAAPYTFTVDTTKPTGTVKAVSAEGRQTEWSDLNNSLTFGFWSNNKITISGTSDDATSPIAKVEYYKAVSQNASDATTALTETQLNNISTWSAFTGFDVTANEQFTVYIKITDKAGNYSYISTNGLIVDDKKPLEEAIAPEITVNPEQPINGIYKGDVKVSIKVDDPLVSGTYSGLKEVSYKVFDKAKSTTEPTQSGVLYSFNNTNPKQSELLKTWTGSITVDSAKNNGNNIDVVVYAVDNAGNGSDDKVSIKIDTTAPVINIAYDNNSSDSSSFFKANRTATVVVTERNFKAEDAKITITNTDGVIPTVSGWQKTAGTGNEDNTTWTATIVYAADGDYTFAIEYTDLAGNKCSSINYATSTVAGTAFTIDKTTPLVDVSYDNNSAQNTNYYKDARTATIVITEHNFNADRVKINLTATDDGAASTLPTVSGWSTNGDKHTATIKYSNDSKYTFDITVKDSAGNDSAQFATQTFFVDKTAPTLSITGVADKSANNGDVIPVVSYSDTNYDDSKVTITLTGANRKSVTLEGSYADVHNGKIYTFKNFAKEKGIDDIYTLTATLTDKAGNTTTQTIDFSVNRFGSTYALSDAANKLNGSYVQTPVDVVITETNANELTNIKITLFKNEKTITLKEGEDYRIDVEGGNGQWYKYTYTIFKKNFEDDGVYRLTIHSEDAAGNIAENTLDTKVTEISFGVDKTAPTINVKNLENGKTYAVENMTVQMSVNDNLKLASVTVYLDGKEHKIWTGEELDKILADGGNFNFDIAGDSTNAHTVKIVCKDAAGNEISEEIADFYVTTNLWVRYYTNKPLFFGSIGGVVLLAGLIVFLVVFKRRKKEEK